LSCHPLENFSSLLGQLNVPKMAELPELQGGEIFTLAGLVSSVQVKPTKKGTLFARFKLEDESAGVRCNAWSESYGKYSQLLKNDQILLITGRIEGGDQAETTLVVDEVVSLVDAVPKRANRALISLPYAAVDQPFLDDIFALLDRHKGKCKVYFSVDTPDEMSVNIAASEVLGVSGSKALEDELKQRNCQINWILN
jgi:DNA polymerase-3 subunit alpha